MSILSNAKAQVSKIYTGAKQTPIAKGIKNVLYEENLKKNAQTKILTNIYKENKKKVDLAPDLYEAGRAYTKENLGVDGGDMRGLIKTNMNKISEAGVDSIEDADLKNILSERFKDDKIAAELQNRAVVNKAKANYAKDGIDKRIIDDKAAKSFVSDAAAEVDGQVSFMTPFEMAKEYYGKPMAGAINNLKAEDYKGAFKNVGIAGARAGATAGAVAGAGALVNGGVSVTANAFDRLRDNRNSGGQQ